MADADDGCRHFLLDEMFQILGKNIPVTDAINSWLIGSTVTLHILASDVRFALGLIWSPLERQLYADAKGGGDWMDFSQIARFLGVELESVAGIFCVLALLVVPATWIVYRPRHALGAASIYGCRWPRPSRGRSPWRAGSRCRRGGCRSQDADLVPM